MKLRQARKIWNKQVKYGVFPHSPGQWTYVPAYVGMRDSTKRRAFVRLAKNGEGPWV